MKPYFNYIIESGLSLGVFTMVYWFFLRKENRFKASRYYLLGALIFSTLLPFLTNHINLFDLLDFAGKKTSSTRINMLETVTIYASGFPAKIGSAILSFNYSMLIYRLGAVAAFFVMAYGIFQLGQMISKNRVFRLKRAKLVISSKEISPYSFLKILQHRKTGNRWYTMRWNM